MTLPRPVVEGDTVLTAKRCINGEFRLRPDREVVQTYLYVLGYCQDKYNILLHEFVGMSNHDHPHFTDPDGNRVRFIQLLHALVARAVNCRFGEWDSLWSGQRHAAVKLLEPKDVVDKAVYVVVNAVAAGLVRYAQDWEGPTSWSMEYGEPITITKPDFFFSKNMPDEVQVTIYRPDGMFPGLSDREARREFRKLAKAKQGELVAELKAQGVTFMGMKRVLRQPRHSTPNSRLERRGIRPHIACKNKWLRIEALENLKLFWSDYKQARLAYEAGDHDAEFPHGTYLMKVRFNVRIRPPP